MFGMKPMEGGCMDVFGLKTSEIQRKATRTGAVSNSFMVKVRTEGDHVLANLLIALIYVKNNAEVLIISRSICITGLLTIDEGANWVPLNMPYNTSDAGPRKLPMMFGRKFAYLRPKFCVFLVRFCLFERLGEPLQYPNTQMSVRFLPILGPSASR